MKFEKINEKKLRITYSVHELEGRNIDPGTIVTNSEEAENLILDMVESIEDRFGVDISSNRLMIEASSTPENEFVVTITDLDEEDKSYSGNVINRKLLKLKQQKEALEKRPEKNVVIRFETIENAVSFAQAIFGRISEKSELYKYKNEYYLNIMPSGRQLLDKTSLLRISSDFGSYISNAGVYEGCLREHARKILAKNAIKRLSEEF